MSTLCASVFTVQEESWTKCLPELRKLFPLHFRELGVNRHRLEAQADEVRYAELEKMGILFLLTVRADGELVGYFSGFIMPHLHYRDSGPWAMTDMYYIKKEARCGAGINLFRAYKALARKRGCRFAVTSCKVHSDNTELLEKLGAKWTDKTFVFALEDECR